MWQVDRDQCFKSTRTIDLLAQLIWKGDSHCSAEYLKSRARLRTGLQHDIWFPMHLCKEQILLRGIVRGRLWCCLVGSNFEESDEARRACKSPCLNLKYRFEVKLKAKWETWVYVYTSVGGNQSYGYRKQRVDWRNLRSGSKHKSKTTSPTQNSCATLGEHALWNYEP